MRVGDHVAVYPQRNALNAHLHTIQVGLRIDHHLYALAFIPRKGYLNSLSSVADEWKPPLRHHALGRKGRQHRGKGYRYHHSRCLTE